MKKIVFGGYLVALCAIAFFVTGCGEETVDTKQSIAQEKQVAQTVAQVGLPKLPNGREYKMAVATLEMRDKALVTYTYLVNMNPGNISRHTALGGKLTYLGKSIGYPLPYSAQVTNPNDGLAWLISPFLKPNRTVSFRLNQPPQRGYNFKPLMARKHHLRTLKQMCKPFRINCHPTCSKLNKIKPCFIWVLWFRTTAPR